MTRNDVRDELVALRDEAAALLEAYLSRPVLRGISHLVGAFTAAIAGLILVLQASGTLQLVASVVYGLGLTLALTTSALYHRIRWRPRAYVRIRKLDHSMIFVLIASSCTPFALLAVHGNWRIAAVAMIWTLAIAGIAVRCSFESLPRWLLVSLYLGMGWSGLSLMPALKDMSPTAFTLTCVGAALYTLGALVYLTKRPNPIPRWFGFHEVFHGFVVAAAACHFIAVWPLVTATPGA